MKGKEINYDDMRTELAPVLEAMKKGDIHFANIQSSAEGLSTEQFRGLLEKFRDYLQYIIHDTPFLYEFAKSSTNNTFGANLTSSRQDFMKWILQYALPIEGETPANHRNPLYVLSTTAYNLQAITEVQTKLYDNKIDKDIIGHLNSIIRELYKLPKGSTVNDYKPSGVRNEIFTYFTKGVDDVKSAISVLENILQKNES